jgi:simple sugar transport system permease protein
VPIQTPIILTVLFIVFVAVVFKTTTLRLYVESVGINPNAARLNGINPKKIIFITFLIMGFCSAVAGFIAVNKAGRHDSVNLLKLIMMDAILAVAIGGNSLGGGKFSISGSVIGAYTIEMLNRTLLRLEIEPGDDQGLQGCLRSSFSRWLHRRWFAVYQQNHGQGQSLRSTAGKHPPTRELPGRRSIG